MKKISTCILLGVVTTIVISALSVSGKDLNAERYNIVISSRGDSISVEEKLTIKGDSNETTYSTVRFWVQDNAEGIGVLINNNPTAYNHSGNEYMCNITALNITMNTSLQATIYYTLSKDTGEFTKTLTYDTTSLSVKFNNENVLSGENMKSSSSFTVKLYKLAEATLSWYIITAIVLLIILLLVLTFYSFRKQKTAKIKEIAGESEELLNTKKNLLMSLLKEVEKKHRSKAISDDTYHKLKELYKQEAVITMKKLEDMKSEVE